MPQDLTPAQTTGIVSLMIDRDELTDNLKELEVELNNTDDALKPVKAGELELVKKQIAAVNTRIAEISQNPDYAVQEPSTSSQVPSVIEGGQNIQEGGERVGQGVEGTQATQEAPIQKPTAEIIPEEEVVTEEPVVEPAKQETPKADKEVERLESDLFRTEIELEDAELEIENEKSNLKEEKARIKQAIADVRKSNLSREEKEDKIEDLKYELEDLIDTHDSLVENYRYDIQDAKKEIAKINKKLKKIAQAPVTPVAPTTVKAKGVSATNKSQLDDLKSRVTDAVKSGVVQTAERAINTLKSILPGFDIVIHENEDSYNDSVLGVGGQTNTRGNFSYSKNADGTYSGRIDINLNKANARTVAHEVAHAVLLKSFGENVKLFKTFRDKISKVLNSSRNAELIKFSNLYEGDVQAEEYLAELTAILEQQQDNLSPTVLQQIAAYINDIVSKLTNGAIKPFENVKDTKDIINFFNTVSGAIREGAELDVDGVSGKINSDATPLKDVSNKIINKATLIQDLGLDRFPEMKDRIYTGYNLKKLGNVKSHLTFSDRLVTGIVDGVDYLGGVLFGAATNRVWASFKETGVKAIIKGMTMNEDGYRYLMPALLSGEAHMSNKDMVNTSLKLVEKSISSDKISPIDADARIRRVLNKKLLEKFKDIYAKEIGNKKITKELVKDALHKAIVTSDSTFEQRKNFLESLLGKADINKKLRFGNLPSFGELATGLAEPITEGHEFGDIILVIRTKGDLVAVQPKKGDVDYHPSYPWVIRSLNKDGSIADVETLLFDKSYNAVDVFPEVTNASGKKLKYEEYKKVYGEQAKSRYLQYLGAGPMSTNVSETVLTEAEPQKPVSKSQKINWEVSKEGKGDPTISVRSNIVQQAAQNLKEGKITNEEYRATASQNSPIGPITRFFAPATEEQVYNAIDARQKEKTNVPVKNGTEVGLRLDINAYQNKNTWVVSVHEGTDNKGKAISYTNVARIVDVNFGVEPKGALGIAAGKSKTTIGRMFGKWKNIEGDTLEQKGENAKKLVQDIVNNPAWVQIGMNPFRHSYFYDRSSDIGRPVMKADEVIQVGGLVYAKNPVYGNWTDESFEVKGLLDSSGKVVKFQKIEEEDNTEALRVAGLPYLENTLDVLSAKFGMPYKVIYNETLTSTGSIDYDNYGEPTIIINTANATNETPLIQYGNIFINQIKNTNKNLFSGLVKQVLNTKEGQAELEFAKERYSNDNYEDQVQQAIVSLLAKYGKNQFDPKTGIHKAIKKIWDTILEFLSNSFNVNINEIPPSTTMEELSKILSHPNISINKTTYSETIKEELVEESKKALENRKKEYSEIEKIQNPIFIEINDRKYITNKKQFDKFYEAVKETVETLKNYKDNQLLVDLTNIKSQISTFEGRENFNYDRYPLFTKLLKFISTSPRTAIVIINDAIESGEDIIKYLNSNSPYIDSLDDNLNLTISDIIQGYSIGGRIGLEPPSMYRIYSSTLDSVDEVKAKLENDIESLGKAIENPELGTDYYYRNFRVRVGDDTYRIVGNYRDGNISIEFSSDKYGMRDANEALFFKVLPKVIDAISYMYSDVNYDTISFTPITGESSKGRDLRLKGYNIFAKRLFGDFGLVAQNVNTTIIPIPEIFKNKLLKQERTVSRSQKVEGEGKAPKKGGPLARIKQAIDKSRAGKTSVDAPKKPLEFEDAEIIPSEKGKANLYKSLNAPARSLNKLKELSQGAGSFFNKVKRAAIDTKYDIAKALTRSKTPIGDVARAAMRNAKGYTGASSLVIKLVNSQIFDRLSFAPNVKMKLIDDKGNTVNTVWSERQLFDAFLDANRIINIDARIRDKFSELVSLSRQLKNGIKNESLTKEEQDELVNKISQLKDYLLRRKSLDIKGPEGQVQMIGYQDPDFVYTDKLINLLKEDYAPIQYTHTDGKTQADAEGILSEIKEQLPELSKTFDKMSSDYYDTFRYLLDESLKNGLITKEVYDELWSYNYIPTKFIQHFIEGELAIDNPSKAKKLSASLKNLTGGSEEDVITNYQYILELYAHATYRRIFDNRAAVKLAQALGKIEPNRFGKDSLFFIQKPNGKDKNGNPTYSNPEKGYDYIKYMVDGVENRIIAPKQFVDMWYDSEFQSTPWLDSTVNFFSKLTLVEFIKGVFTKYSPVFGITQILLDAPQALISTKAYPDFFLGSVLLAKDYATVAKDVLSIVRDGKPTKFFVEAVQAGVFSDFLSTENDLIKGEKFTNYDGTDNVKNKVKYLISRVNRGVDKTLQTIAKINEAVEYSTRLAVYYRMKLRLTAKFKKDNNGAEPTGQDLENIQLLSAEQARNVVDFSVSGGVGKQANRLFAYLNSAIQVFVSAARSLKNNPWKAGLMMLEIGAASASILAYSLGDLGGDDDEEKKKRYKEYRKRSTYEKESYFLMWTGDPERPFLRIPKPPLFKGFINIFEQAYLHASRGEDFNQEKMWSAFKRDIPFGNPLAELTRNPMINAMFKYFNNYDQFRQENIVDKEKDVRDFAETRGATELYKKIGKASKDLGFKEGVSPRRLQEAVRSFTGDPTKNTWAALFDMGSKGSVALATGDTKELDKMFTGNPISDAFRNLGFEAKLFTKPIDYDASFAEQLEEDKKDEYTIRYVIGNDVYDIRNNSKDVRSAVKSIYEYLKPKVESKEIDAEYANKVVKAQLKLYGIKDAPYFYDDVFYENDNDTKAKMLNYYLSDMSNSEAGKVMNDMVSKGLISNEAYLKTVNLRAGKK